MEDVLRSISVSLSASVKLPSLLDCKINFLRSRRQERRWLGGFGTSEEQKWTSRFLELELLLAEVQAKKRPNGARRNEDPVLVGLGIPPLLTRSPWSPHHVLKDVSGLAEATISSVIMLGDVFPICGPCRMDFNTWIQKNKKHFHFRLGQDRLLAQLLRSENGQNLLIMLIFLWASLRKSEYFCYGYKNRKGRIFHWIARLLSSVFAARGTPARLVPSTDELERLARLAIPAFHHKELQYLQVYINHEADFDVQDSRAMKIASLTSSASEVGASHIEIDVPSVSRLLVQLSFIAKGDRSEVLVCGELLSGLEFYTEYMLAIKTEIRTVDSSGTSRIVTTDERDLSSSPDVIIYRSMDSIGNTPQCSEILRKGSLS